MKHCTNCGHELKESLSFCSNCGEKVKKSIEKLSTESRQTTPTISSPTEDVAQTPKSIRKKTSKKKKGLWIGLITVLFLLVATHFTIKTITDPSKKIIAMNEALQNDDAKAFLNEFTFDKNVHSDPPNFLKYVKEHDWPSLRQAMQNDVSSLEETGISDTIMTNGMNFVHLVKKNILGGLYYTIDFELVPVTQFVYNNDYDNIEVSIEDITETLKKGEPMKIGQFLPGNYKWSAVLHSEFGKLPFDGTIEMNGQQENKFPIDINPKFAKIFSNNSEATLYVNGKSTQQKVDDSPAIGPLSLDGSVTVQAIVKSGDTTYKTEKVKVDQEEIHLDFDYVQKEKDAAEKKRALEEDAFKNRMDVVSFYERYRKAYESDLNNHVYDATSYYLQSDSKAEKELKSFFPQYVDQDKISNHTNNVASFEAINANTFKLVSNEKYTFYSKEGPIYDYEYRRTYTIVKNSTNYVITNINKQKISESVSNND